MYNLLAKWINIFLWVSIIVFHIPINKYSLKYLVGFIPEVEFLKLDYTAKSIIKSHEISRIPFDNSGNENKEVLFSVVKELPSLFLKSDSAIVFLI